MRRKRQPIAAVLLVALIVGFIVLTSYNAIVALRQRIDKAWSNIDVILKQRHDELPNLVTAVRDLMAFERDVLTRVTETRAAYTAAAPIPAQAATSAATSAAVRSLFAVVERYPDLKSHANVTALQAEIERLEAMLADRRELYNDQVYRYNTRDRPGPWRPPRACLRLAAAPVLRRRRSRRCPAGRGSQDGVTWNTGTAASKICGWSGMARRSGPGSAATRAAPISR